MSRKLIFITYSLVRFVIIDNPSSLKKKEDIFSEIEEANEGKAFYPRFLFRHSLTKPQSGFCSIVATWRPG